MPNFEPTACGLYARDPHGWKLDRGLLGALGKDRPVSHAAAEIQWRAVATKMARFAASVLYIARESVPTHACRMCETRPRVLKSVL